MSNIDIYAKHLTDAFGRKQVNEAKVPEDARAVGKMTEAVNKIKEKARQSEDLGPNNNAAILKQANAAIKALNNLIVAIIRK